MRSPWTRSTGQPDLRPDSSPRAPAPDPCRRNHPATTTNLQVAELFGCRISSSPGSPTEGESALRYECHVVLRHRRPLSQRATAIGSQLSLPGGDDDPGTDHDDRG